MVNYLVYSDEEYITKYEIIAALLNVIKKYADFDD